MSIRIHNKGRWLLVGTPMLMMAGCAAHQAGKLARNEVDCPMNFVLTCEATRPGATTASNCRCIRHRDINALLHGQP